MKKILALLLALVMVFALAACGQQAAPEEKPAEEPAAPAEEPAAETPVEEAPAEEPAEAPAEEAPVEVMSYADFMAAEVDDPVVIEAYVQAKQAYASDWSNTSVYLADQDGAYFAYRLACTQEEYDALVPGAKIRVTGFKAEWAGEIEIAEGCTFELIDGADTYLVDPVDVTELLGTDALAEHMNQLVTIKGVTVAESEGGVAFLYNWDGSGEDGSDLYFNVTLGENTYNFTVESDLCPAGSEVYETVKGLNVGDTIDLVGFLYWYEGPNPHITAVTPAA